VGDLDGGATGPAEAGDGIASGIVFEQFVERGDYSGRFFSVLVRPPP